jgi:hypothetical protein
VLAAHNQIHDICRVPLAVEFDQLVANARLAQACEVACAKAAELAVFVGKCLEEVDLAPAIVPKDHVELRVHRLHLSIDHAFFK